MPDMSFISVPCRCGATLLLGYAACPSCQTKVSPELREALDTRLESAHSEYREAKRELDHASAILLVLGLLHVVVGALVLFLAGGFDSTSATGEAARGALVSPVANGVIGVALFGCYYAARRAPTAAMTAALATWALARLVLCLVAPAEILLSFLSAMGIGILLAKVAVFIVLVQGVQAGRRLRLIREGVTLDSASLI